MQSLLTIIQELTVQYFKMIYVMGTDILPKILAAVFTLFIGWLFASVSKKVLAKLLKAAGTDVLSHKTGLARFLEKRGVAIAFSSLIGLCVYWLIIFRGLSMAFTTLGLGHVAALIDRTLLFLPRGTIAAIILTAGIFISNFADQFATSSARLAQLPFSTFIGKVARYIVIGVFTILTFEYLGVAPPITAQLFMIIFILLPAVLVVAFIIGGKDIVSQLLASFFLKGEYKPGARISVNGLNGTIEAVDLVSTRIRTLDGQVRIPNVVLLSSVTRSGEQTALEAGTMIIRPDTTTLVTDQ